MKTRTKARAAYTPTAWQWDPSSLRTDGMVQFWTAEGSMSLVKAEEARRLVARKACFVGSVNHVCQVHEGIQ